MKGPKPQEYCQQGHLMSKTRKGRPGFTYCSECKRNRSRQNSLESWHKKPLYARRYNLKSKYGITLEEHAQAIINQNNKCLICSTEFDRTPATDHDHLTGIFRGLLCHSCNTGLGYFKDNTGYLSKAIEYLNSRN